MKKIYLLAVTLMALAATTSAQSYSGDCPPGKIPSAIKYNYTTPGGQNYCVVVVSNSWDTAQLTLFAGTQVIPYESTPPKSYINTDQNGGASFLYDCNTYNATFAQVCSAGHGCCRIQVIQGASLPVKLTSFTGRLQTDNIVDLDWTSVIELESYQYQVERSADGKTYTPVGFVKASGSSSSQIKYGFTDNLPSAGAFYYRLKQIDIDGSFEYSKVVYVNSKKGAGVITKVFPNPFTNEVQLIGATSADMIPANIKVFNVTGQMIKYRIVGANAISIDDAAPSGVYFLKFKQDEVFKLLKK